MPRETIIQVLMRRDNMTKVEAKELLKEAYEVFDEYLAIGDIDNAEDICMEYFSLEPDYLDEFF